MSRLEKQVDMALWFAYTAHHGQYRKHMAEPYILHPIRVWEAARAVGVPIEGEVAALLHDVVEDCDVAVHDLEACAFGDRAIELVVKLTKTWKGPGTAEQLRKYYTAIEKDFLACTLKVLDRTDNLRDIVRVLAANPGDDAIVKWASLYKLKTGIEIAPLAALCPHAIREAFCDAKEKAQYAIDRAYAIRT